MPVYRFHENHGINVCLSDDGDAAKRTTSFANAITFSETPLKQGEIFMVEVDEQEMGWSGHLRCGLTQHCPSKMVPASNGEPMNTDASTAARSIPMYSMPDLTSMGQSWIFAITKHHNKVPQRSLQDDSDDDHHASGFSETSSFIQNCGNALQVGDKILPPNILIKDFGNIELDAPQTQGPKHGAVSSPQGVYNARRQQLMATSVGSRIGITYEVQNTNTESKLYMHLIINGEDQGPSLMENADPRSPIYATDPLTP